MAKTQTIEVDEATANVLQARAEARGMSVADLIADLAFNEQSLPAEFARMRSEGQGPWSIEVLQEDARRLAEFQKTREGVPWPEVKDWLQTWGRPNELSAPKSRKL